jgi:predicted ABC-type ATPase
LQMMLDARSTGFEIVLIYIGTESVEINLGRIADRVLAGGHDVPEADVRRRYARSLKNLPIAISRADHAIIFDNSSEQGYQPIGVITDGRPEWLLEKLPTWALSLKVV